MTIVQADTDQMNPRASQCEQHFLQIPRLFEAEMADDIVGGRKLLHPGWSFRVLKIMSVDIE